MSQTKPCPSPLLAGYVRLSTLAALVWASAAFAQPAGLPGFELERLELNPNGKGSLVMGAGELLPPGGFRLSLAGHYEKNPLALYSDGARVGAVVSDRATAHLLLAWAPLSWLELGAQLSLVAWQRGEDLGAQGLGTPAQTGLGTPSVSVRLGLLAQRRAAPLDLAVELGVGLPLGSVDTLSRDATFRFSPKLTVGRRFGVLRAGLEAGALVRPRVALNDDFNIQDELGNEVRLGAVLATTNQGLRGELNVRGTLPLTRQDKSVEVLAGLRLPAGDLAELYVLGGPGFGDTPGTPLFRVLAGVAFGGAEPDTSLLDDDGDGVRNRDDACPREPGPREQQGCPVRDSDDDGIIDSADKCPREPGPAERQGCPVKDTDGDGIDDDKDKCPRETGPLARQGCPVKDTDGDGVVDEKDACPSEAGLVELRGCPAKDTDGDGVADHLDNCPTEKGVASNQGCPVKEKQLVIIQKNELKIKQAVFFSTNKAAIRPRSFKMLNQIARVINAHPELAKVVIEGHTDSQGNANTNRKLSLARAASVRAYLIKKGVDAARLEAQGFGPDRPLASNKNSKGRAANRRVVFSIINPDSAP